MDDYNEFNSPEYLFRHRGVHIVEISQYNYLLPDPNTLSLKVATAIANEVVTGLMQQKSVILDFSKASFTSYPFPAGTGFCKIIDILRKYYSKDFLDQALQIVAEDKPKYLYEYIYFDKYYYSINEEQ